MYVSLVASVCLTVAAVAVWRGRGFGPTPALTVAFMVGLSLLMSALFGFADYLSGNGIDQSVIFHLTFGLEGGGLSDFSDVMVAGGVSLLAILVLAIVSYQSLRQERANRSWVRVRDAVAAVALIGALVINPTPIAVARLVALPSTEAVEVPDRYVVPPKLVIPDHSRYNIVYLYLESLERTYFDEERFPGLMPNLAALEKEALSFTKLTQIYGTNWTIAGMAASQCGVPLVMAGANNSMAGADAFLPGATCLGDMLSENGYDLTYIGGADLEFAGKGSFYTSHSFDNVYGLNELRGYLPQPDYLNTWGLYDDTLFEVAREKFDAMAARADEQPFGLFMLTLDTHHPNGFLAADCADIPYGDGTNPSLNAAHCSDMEAAAFIRYVRSSPVADNTIVVVASDHFAMTNTAWDMLESGPRTNLFMIFGPGVTPGEDARAGTQLDQGATLLGFMGVPVSGWGFGRDLLQTAVPNLMEAETDPYGYLLENRRFFSSLWSFPDIRDGITLDSAAQEVVIGRRRVQAPVLFLIDDDHSVSDMRFDTFSPKKLPQQVAELDQGQRFVWIDTCDRLGAFRPPQGAGAAGYCTVYGALNNPELRAMPLGEGEQVTYQQLLPALTQQAADEGIFAARKTELETAPAAGPNGIQRYIPQNVLGGRYAISSAAFGNGPSYVTNLDTASRTEAIRGLTLFGLNIEKGPVNLGHVDTCADGGAIAGAVTLSGTFAEAMREYAADYGAFAIIAHDSAVCDGTSLAPLFYGSGLVRWTEIGLRTPYVAVISGNGDVAEYLGGAKTAIVVDAAQFVRPIHGISQVYTQRRTEAIPRVGHAGGGYDSRTYSNSIDALDNNQRYFDLIELDLSWTSDNELVCIHDWTRAVRSTFGLDVDGPFTLADFKRYATTLAPQENCTLETLAVWLRANPKVRIVTDIKGRVYEALSRIAKTYPDLVDRFVPQVYVPQDYAPVRSLGFEDVIWTTYRALPTEAEVLAWLPELDLYALTLSQDEARSGLALRAFNATGVRSYVSTIDDDATVEDLRALGVSEIYTNWLNGAVGDPLARPPAGETEPDSETD